MANNKSAKKRILQTAVRTERNRYYRTRIKNIVKAVHEAVEAADKTAAATAFTTANKQIHALVSKGLNELGLNQCYRDSLHKMVNKLEAA